MKTRLLAFSVSLICSIICHAQSFDLSLLVTDQDKKPISFAKIQYLNQAYICDENGNLNIQIQEIEKERSFEVRALGYENKFIDADLATLKWMALQKPFRIAMDRAIQNLEVVHVDATRPANLQSSATLIDVDEDIEAKNFGQDIPILLNNTPSVVTTSDAGAGIGYTGIRIRGVDGERINVTINGIPVNDPESHGVWWVNMPDLIGSTDNIMIQRGVGSSTNGAASFGASINIKTDDISKNAYGTIDNAVGSFNSWKSSVRAGTGLINNKFSMDVRLSRILSDGYIDRASSNLKSFYLSGAYVGEKSLIKAVAFSGKERTYQSWYGTPESVINEDIDEMNAYADRNYLSDSDRANLLESGRTYNYYTYQDEVDNYQQDNYQLHFTHKFSPKSNLNIAGHYTKGRGYYEQFRTADDLAAYGIDPVVIGMDTVTSSDLIRRRWLDNDFVGGVFSFSHRFDKSLNLVFGGAANTYIGDHFGEIVWARLASNSEIYDKYYDNNAQKTEASSYIKLDYTINKWNFYGDIQYRYVRYNFGGFDDVSGNLIDLDQQEIYNFFNPKLGISYLLSANHRLYANGGISQREPVRKDFRESSVNSRPKHEVLRNLELGHSYQKSALRLTTNLYYMNYKDQLINTGKINDVGAYTRINVDNSYRAGIEFTLDYRVFDKFTVQGAVAFSQNRIETFTEYIDNYDDPNYQQTEIIHTNTNMALSPNLVGNIGFTYEPIENLSLSWMSKYVGEQFLDNTSNHENFNRKIDAFSYTNLSLNYTLENVLFQSITLGLQCNNAFNAMYSNNGYTWGYIAGGTRTVENFYYPQAGRNFMFRLLIEI